MKINVIHFRKHILYLQIQNWNISGLPRDIFSIENGIIMENSSGYSLFIDPQNQANKWIKEMERNNQISVVKFTQSDYMKVGIP